MKKSIFLMPLVLTIFISCGDNEEKIVEVPVPSACYPEAPRDVEVWNYPDFVTIWWWHPDPDGDLDYYKIYRSEFRDSLFEEIAIVEAESFETGEWAYYDYSTSVGEQFFYAVSAVNNSNLESELSYEIVTGTQRPEGILTLYSNLDRPDSSGYNMVSQSGVSQNFELPSTDMYFTITEGYSIPCFVVDYPAVMIQDYGFFGYDDVSFDYLHRAPEEGWSNSNTVETIEGHCYILRLGEADGFHYAKLWIKEINVETEPNYVTFWWAYQTVANNRDLSPTPTNDMGRRDDKTRNIDLNVD